jgi:hypothetical protein
MVTTATAPLTADHQCGSQQAGAPSNSRLAKASYIIKKNITTEKARNGRVIVNPTCQFITLTLK